MTTKSHLQACLRKEKAQHIAELQQRDAMQHGLAQRNRELQNVINHVVNMVEDQKPHSEIFIAVSRYRK